MSINACAFTISNTPGTSGAFTVSAADAGAVRVPRAADDAQVCRLFIREGTAFEIRSGAIYTHSGTSMSRGSLVDSSTGSAISFTSAAIVTVIGWDADATDRSVLVPQAIPSVGTGIKAYPAHGGYSAGGTLAITANRVYLLRFHRVSTAKIDAIGFRIPTVVGAGGTQAICAVYEVDASGVPNASPLATSNTVAVDTTGNKYCTFTTPFVPPENFVVAFLCDGAPTITGFATSMSELMGWGTDATFSPTSYVHHVGATGLSFPTSWTLVGNTSNATRPHLIARVV